MKKALLSCLTAMAILGTAASQADSLSTLDLPQIGEPADNTLSPSEEKTLGGRVVAHGGHF